MKRKRKTILVPILVCVLLFCLAAIVSGRTQVGGPAVTDPPQISDAPETPTPTPVPTVPTSPTLDPNLPEIDTSDLQYILINDLSYSNHLRSSYEPELKYLQDEQSVNVLAYDAFEALIGAAKSQGFTVYINCGYRSYSSQEYIFNGKASQIAWDGTYTYAQAVEMARKTVAYPGSSEHQLGLAADIVDKAYPNGLNAEELSENRLLNWLADNCAEYGFILRYPEHKEELTGRSFEPWHFRYVGVEAATYIMNNDLCLEEFLALYE